MGFFPSAKFTRCVHGIYPLECDRTPTAIATLSPSPSLLSRVTVCLNLASLETVFRGFLSKKRHPFHLGSCLNKSSGPKFSFIINQCLKLKRGSSPTLMCLRITARDLEYNSRASPQSFWFRRIVVELKTPIDSGADCGPSSDCIIIAKALKKHQGLQCNEYI